ncbi:MAG TPA: hypothetical protein VHY76_16440 [Acetobacteraceae bacterium]|nr:hypothetical protein [Acetobacteraceae bacterium]
MDGLAQADLAAQPIEAILNRLDGTGVALPGLDQRPCPGRADRRPAPPPASLRDARVLPCCCRRC